MDDKPQPSIAVIQRTLRAGCGRDAGLGFKETEVRSTLGYSASEPQGNVKGAASGGNRNNQPTHDQLYLASALSNAAPRSSGRLSPAALQRLNDRYGVQTVTDSLRLLRGFPPEIAVRSTYAYVERMCKGDR